jgi:hypothetical protein
MKEKKNPNAPDREQLFGGGKFAGQMNRKKCRDLQKPNGRAYGLRSQYLWPSGGIASNRIMEKTAYMNLDN